MAAELGELRPENAENADEHDPGRTVLVGA
jgi:hypothetical protein